MFIGFEVLTDVLGFSLDHAYLKMPDGRLLRQKFGIPMGDPISPAMTIGSCGFMEREWNNTIHSDTKRRFRAKRYMDDVLMLVAESPSWDFEKFQSDFTSQVYWPPLKLEPATDDIFLETKFSIDASGCHYRLKNANEGRTGDPVVWRYQHFNSYGEYAQKRSTLAGCLTKVHGMASDTTQLFYSGVEKLKEFAELGYPRGIRRYACTSMVFKTGDRTWFDIRDAQ